MFKLAIVLFYSLLVSSIYESNSESPDHCSEYCLNVLKPLLENMADNQRRWNEWDSIRLNETQTRLESVENQLKGLKEKLALLESNDSV